MSNRLIETDAFPIEFISPLAERESWRKEVHRPIYHMHKWWAKRLGSVFRGILLGCLLPESADFKAEFYAGQKKKSFTVLDPFMGGGTTIGEAHKLGCVALGRDINPVACEVVRVSLGTVNEMRLREGLNRVDAIAGEMIRSLYRVEDGEVLYFFWVKVVNCPACTKPVDLFSSRIFASNAYPERKPEIQVLCPACSAVFASENHKEEEQCPECHAEFKLHSGPASGNNACCPSCGEKFAIAEAVRQRSSPPEHRLYAKLVLTPQGDKVYLRATPADIARYQECEQVLREELNARRVRIPTGNLEHGYNTKQAIGYNYRQWKDFFNARQLLALGWLQDAIAKLDDADVRDTLFLLFSGTLEFNNLFASYKGEGTGAVRHMFAHHILKPERIPIEANVWGTPKSSGSFTSLFKTRLLRAIDYRSHPTELSNDGSKKRDCNLPFDTPVQTDWHDAQHWSEAGIYLTCGSSDKVSLPDGSIDLVLTDPPFFDNVHYSELADFFLEWQRIYPRGFINGQATTRNPLEVQDVAPERFATKLQNVFRECHRVLKTDGLLVFTYHHSRQEGWESLVDAIYGAGFTVVNAHPVKSEMSVAAPKAQAKEPIQLDTVLVCQKSQRDRRGTVETHAVLSEAREIALHKATRLEQCGLTLSRNDRTVIFLSQVLACLGKPGDIQQAKEALRLACDETWGVTAAV